MKEYIFKGKTEEEALALASKELKLDLDEIKYEVIEKETKLFGMISKNTKIRVFLQEDINLSEIHEDTDRGIEEDSFYEEETPIIQKKIVYKGDKAKKTLETILEMMDVKAELTMNEDDESIQINIKTNQEEAIIGRDGRTLHAIQFITNKIVNRMPEDRKRIILDSEGFRFRREQSLKDLAKNLSEKCKKSGKIIGINPMNPQDRRIIHLTLKNDKDVTTRSEGNGLFRRLLIIPQRKKI